MTCDFSSPTSAALSEDHRHVSTKKLRKARGSESGKSCGVFGGAVLPIARMVANLIFMVIFCSYTSNLIVESFPTFRFSFNKLTMDLEENLKLNIYKPLRVGIFRHHRHVTSTCIQIPAYKWRKRGLGPGQVPGIWKEKHQKTSGIC